MAANIRIIRLYDVHVRRFNPTFYIKVTARRKRNFGFRDLDIYIYCSKEADFVMALDALDGLTISYIF